MPKRILKGKVVSDKMTKTVIVRVERSYMCPTYKKIIKSSKKYAAHFEQLNPKEGDFVSIIESAPISKTKKWRVIEN
jgi:small subunit ribosomal protein S17